MRWLLRTRVPAALTVYTAALVVVFCVCSLVGTAAGRGQGEGWIVTVSSKGQPWVVHYKQGSGEAKLYDLHFRPPSPVNTQGFEGRRDVDSGGAVSQQHAPGVAVGDPGRGTSATERDFVEGYEATGTDRLWFLAAAGAGLRSVQTPTRAGRQGDWGSTGSMRTDGPDRSAPGSATS